MYVTKKTGSSRVGPRATMDVGPRVTMHRLPSHFIYFPLSLIFDSKQIHYLEVTNGNVVGEKLV